MNNGSGGAITVEELQILITAKYGDALKDIAKMAAEVSKKFAPVQKQVKDALAPNVEPMKQAVKQSATDATRLAETMKVAAEAAERIAKAEKEKRARSNAGSGRSEADIMREVAEAQKRNQAVAAKTALLEKERAKFAKRDDLVQQARAMANVAEQAKKAAKAAQVAEKIRAAFDGARKSISSVGNALGKFGKMLGKLGTTPIKGLLKGFQSIRKYISGKFGSSFSGITKKLGQFTKLLASSVIYSSVFGAISKINGAIKQGTDNLYQYSKAFSGAFSQNLDKIATNALYIQNSFSAMASPLINAVTPAIEMLSNKLVDMLNVVNQVFSKITGASSWTKAVKVQKEYAEATNDTADAAEKAKYALAGFDEVNVLNFGKDSGSASSAVNPDPTTMFEEVALEPTAFSWVDDIKASVESGDWAGLGTMLAEKVNGLINSVDFTGFGEKVGAGIQSGLAFIHSLLSEINFENVGTGFAQSLNGLMDGVDFNLMGQTIADGFNMLIDTVYGFVNEFDWTQFGVSAGEMLNGGFENIHLDKAVLAINNGVLGLLESAKQFLRTTNWKDIGNTVGDALNNIDWSSIIGGSAAVLGDALIGLCDIISGFLQGYDWRNLGNELWDSLVAIITEVNWTGIVESAFEYLGSAVGAAGALILGFAEKAWAAIKQGFEDTKAYFGKYIEEAGGDVIGGIFKGISDALLNVGTWIKEHIFQPFIDGFKKVFGIHSPSTVMAEQGAYIIDGLLNGITDTWDKVKNFFDTSLENVKTAFSDAWNSIKTTAITVFTSMKTGVTNVWNSLWGGLKSVINWILGGVEKMANGVVSGINACIRALNGLSFDVPDWVPLIGGETFGFSISELRQVSIPRLANGAVISSPTMALMGEYAGAMGNPEIVAPQNIIYDTVVEANAPLVTALYGMVREIISEMRSIDHTVEIDGNEVGRTVQTWRENYARRTGAVPV